MPAVREWAQELFFNDQEPVYENVDAIADLEADLAINTARQELDAAFYADGRWAVDWHPVTGYLWNEPESEELRDKIRDKLSPGLYHVLVPLYNQVINPGSEPLHLLDGLLDDLIVTVDSQRDDGDGVQQIEGVGHEFGSHIHADMSPQDMAELNVLSEPGSNLMRDHILNLLSQPPDDQRRFWDFRNVT